MTSSGPEPLEARRSRIDPEHYLTTQLQPIADAILQPMGESFTSLTSTQRGLFLVLRGQVGHLNRALLSSIQGRERAKLSPERGLLVKSDLDCVASHA